MERTIKWEPAEDVQMKMIEQEKTQILAQIGALMMDLDLVKQKLQAINDRQRAAIQQVIQSRGIGAFESARPIQGGVVLQISDNGGGGNASTN